MRQNSKNALIQNFVLIQAIEFDFAIQVYEGFELKISGNSSIHMNGDFFLRLCIEISFTMVEIFQFG